MRRGCRRLALPVWLALAAISLPGAAEPTAQAQQGWSEPIILFSTSAQVTFPRLVADPSGDVHLFFALQAPGRTDDEATQTRDTSERLEDPRADGGSDRREPDVLMYARLHDGAWSSPTDVLISPDRGRVDTLAVAIDQQGILHVVWQGGPLAQIYYSRAHVTQASSAPGWSQPQVLSEVSGGSSADISAATDGSLHVVYSDRSGNIYYRQSVDGGRTWSPRTTVSDVARAQRAADYPRIAVDDRHRIHVVWTELQLPQGWPPLGAFYSTSQAGGTDWSPALPVAGEQYGQVNVATFGSDNVHLVWNGTVAIGERIAQRSVDGGQTWIGAQKIATPIKGGFTGFPSVTFDSEGTLHLVTAVDSTTSPSGQRSAGGVYHLSAAGGATWSDPVHVSQSGVEPQADELPWIVTSLGNRLHVVYEDSYKRIWYTSRLTESHAVAPSGVPAPPVARSEAPPPVRISLPSSAPALSSQPRQGSGQESSPVPVAFPTRDPLAWSVAPVLALLVGVVLLRLLRR